MGFYMSTGVPPETFGELVARMRSRAGLSQTALGQKVQRSRGSVQSWENDAQVPEAEVFPRLAEALRVPMDALLERAGVAAVTAPADPALSDLAERAEAIGRELRALATASASESETLAAANAGDEPRSTAEHGNGTDPEGPST